MSVAELPLKIEAIIYTIKDGSIEYLLIKRTPEDGGFWQPVTGTVHDGERLVDCLTREIQEETGITKIDNVSDCLYRFDWQRKSGERLLEFVYAVKVPADSKIILAPDEHEDYKWCSFNEALDTLCTDNNKKSFEVINQHLVDHAA